MRIFIWILSLWVACAAGTPTAAQTGIASGPLRISSVNSRYFTDGSGRAVYLAGSHNWHNFQDNGHRLPEGQDPPPLIDFTAYLRKKERGQVFTIDRNGLFATGGKWRDGYEIMHLEAFSGRD